MNRRELFQAIAGATAAAGVSLKASTVEASAAPALVVVELPKYITQDHAQTIREALTNVLRETPFKDLKVVVISDDMRLTFLDTQGRILNQRVEDTEK